MPFALSTATADVAAAPVLDQVYANSVFDPSAKFTSMEALARKHKVAHPAATDAIDAFTHIVFGISKARPHPPPCGRYQRFQTSS